MGSNPHPDGARALGVGVDDALARLDAQSEAMIARTMEWSAVNSGSLEPEGLARMRSILEEAFAVLPGAVELIALAPSTRVRADGGEALIEHGSAIRVRVRPEAPLQVALTGHYDTVFPAAHAFQKPWREGAHLRGPGDLLDVWVLLEDVRGSLNDGARVAQCAARR
jgi:glutamate carboxypeptidase